MSAAVFMANISDREHNMLLCLRVNMSAVALRRSRAGPCLRMYGAVSQRFTSRMCILGCILMTTQASLFFVSIIDQRLRNVQWNGPGHLHAIRLSLMMFREC